MTLYKITHQKLKYFRYAKNTIDTYLHYVDEFESSINKHYTRINAKDIQNYINQYKFTSGSQQNQIISALKFAWHKALGKKYLKIDFRRPRKQKKVPKVINAELLASKIKDISNLKHRAILTLGLSCGLRISEVINLQWSDLDRDRNILYVFNSKGQKDRVCVLNDNLINLLENYWLQYRSQTYVFNGQSKQKYSATSIQNIVKKYIHSKASFHLLRHSYATYALDQGTQLAPLSKSLGHKSTKTTEIYYHNSAKSLNSIKQAI